MCGETRACISVVMPVPPAALMFYWVEVSLSKTLDLLFDWVSCILLLRSPASCLQMLIFFSESNEKIIQRRSLIMKTELKSKWRKFPSARIRAAERSCHFSRALSQSFSGLRPGSSNPLCHMGSYAYRPHHDTAATHPWEACRHTRKHKMELVQKHMKTERMARKRQSCKVTRVIHSVVKIGGDNRKSHCSFCSVATFVSL